MSWHDLWLFVPACFALNMTFGPNNLLALTNGAKSGTVIAVAASIGRCLAFAIMIGVVALGLGALLLTSAWLFTAVKWVGAAYLIWLGVKLLRSKGPVLAPGCQESACPPLRSLVREEFLVAASNPKAILIFTAFFPQFVDMSHYLSSFALLGLIFLLLELVAIIIYATIGFQLGALLATPSTFHWCNRASGVLMIGFGLMLTLARRPEAT